MSAGFYRVSESGELVCAVDGVSTPSGRYVVADHASYSYPIDGTWRYYASESDALIGLSPSSGGVPSVVSMAQARRALHAAGLLASVDAAVAAADADTQIMWEYATTVARNSPFIAAIGPGLGLSDAQIDALFVAAARY